MRLQILHPYIKQKDLPMAGLALSLSWLTTERCNQKKSQKGIYTLLTRPTIVRENAARNNGPSIYDLGEPRLSICPRTCTGLTAAYTDTLNFQ